MTTQTTLERQPAAGEVLKLLPRFVIAFAFIGAMLFVPARTLNWPMAWAMIGVFLVYMVALTALLLRYNPGLIAERSRVMTHDTKGFDKVITAVMTPVYFGTWVLAGLDYRNGWSPPFPPSSAGRWSPTPTSRAWCASRRTGASESSPAGRTASSAIPVTPGSSWPGPPP
jgi:hypothetical protein